MNTTTDPMWCPCCGRPKRASRDTCDARLCKRVHHAATQLAISMVGLGAAIGRFVRMWGCP